MRECAITNSLPLPFSGTILQELYFALSNTDANLDIEKILEKATPAIMDIPKSSKQVLMEEASKQEKITSDVKAEVSKGKSELKALSESKLAPSEGKQSIRKIMESSLQKANSEVALLLHDDSQGSQAGNKLSKKLESSKMTASTSVCRSFLSFHSFPFAQNSFVFVAEL